MYPDNNVKLIVHLWDMHSGTCTVPTDLQDAFLFLWGDFGQQKKCNCSFTNISPGYLPMSQLPTSFIEQRALQKGVNDLLM